MSKCNAFGCTNDSNDGLFVGQLCHPCHHAITTGNAPHGTAWFFALRAQLDEVRAELAKMNLENLGLQERLGTTAIQLALSEKKAKQLAVYSELVERLRGDGNDECDHDGCLHCMREAADAIEAQLREMDEARAGLAKGQKKLGTLAAEHMAQRMDADALRSQPDEARADLENERAMRAGEHDDTHSRIEKLHAELVEARAELAKGQKKLGTLAAEHMAQRMDADALRSAVAEHDKHCRCTWFASYPPPSAAPAASEPGDYISISELVAKWEKDPAMAELIVSARKRLAPLLYRDGDPRRERMERGEGPAASEPKP